MKPSVKGSTMEERALARKSWPVRRFALGEEPADDLLATTTAAERIEMLAELSDQAYALSGRLRPTYERAAAPIRRRRLHEISVEDPSPS